MYAECMLEMLQYHSQGLRIVADASALKK